MRVELKYNNKNNKFVFIKVHSIKVPRNYDDYEIMKVCRFFHVV